MGLTVGEMMASNAFSGYRLLAGGDGLDNQIQGIAILDAPDGYQWTRGRELVISSGYIFHENPGLLEEMIGSDQFKMMSGLGIKERFVKDFSPQVLEAFDNARVPLILIPPQVAWMDIMNQLNVMVMNKNIRQFNIGRVYPGNYADLTYQSRKIERILSQIEKEMGFPGMLYDLSKQKPYFSSGKFLKLADQLKVTDFWNPSFPVTTDVLCDNLSMVRYRYRDERYEIPYSWITVPITVMGQVKAYFVLVEATGLIDYFDQFAIRIGFLLLQSLYEQFLFLESIGDVGFEKFVSDIVDDKLARPEDIRRRAADINLEVSSTYYALLMRQLNPVVTTSAHKDQVHRTLNSTFSFDGIRVCFVNQNNVMLLIPREEKDLGGLQLASIKEKALEVKKKLASAIKGAQIVFGAADAPCQVQDLKKAFSHARQAVTIGCRVYPDNGFVAYSQLGALAWIHIEEGELQQMVEDLEAVLGKEEHAELVQTLKVYLNCKMNYSLTAKSMFIHINTVRKRIEQVNDLLGLDLEDPVSRLKLEMLLMLV